MAQQTVEVIAASGRGERKVDREEGGDHVAVAEERGSLCYLHSGEASCIGSPRKPVQHVAIVACSPCTVTSEACNPTLL